MTYSAPKLKDDFKLDCSLIDGLIYRVYSKKRPKPLEFSTCRRNRYDCPEHKPMSFGVIYAAYNIETCWMETVVRGNMVRPAGEKILIPEADIINRGLCEIYIKSRLKIAHFFDEKLIHLGESASNIMAEEYERTREWAYILYAHKNPEIDGFQYRSRFSSGEMCLVIFDRAFFNDKLALINTKDLDPSICEETQEIIEKYNISPI